MRQRGEVLVKPWVRVTSFLIHVIDRCFRVTVFPGLCNGGKCLWLVGTCCGCGVAGVGARAPLADDEGGARGDQKAVTPLIQLGEVEL